MAERNGLCWLIEVSANGVASIDRMIQNRAHKPANFKTGNTMKKYIVLTFFAAMIVACTQPKEEAVVAIETAPEAPEPAAYYEFLWCSFGENYSEEARDAYFAEFNTIADSMTERGLRAFGYRPRDWESKDFDALWVNRWPDKQSSTEGWAEWRERGGNDTLQENNPNVLACGQQAGTDVFGYTTYIPKDRPSTFSIENPPYHADNLFCSFNEGKGPEDIRAFIRNHYLPFTEAYTKENPDNSYWFAIGVPDFEPAEDYPHDFNWINYFSSAEEAADGINEYETNQTDLQNRLAEIVTCADRDLWDAIPIRVPANST